MKQKTVLAELKKIRHFYEKGSGEDFLVLDDINLTIYENEIVSLLGRSGSGKSTLLRLISGLTQPTEGSISLGTKNKTLPLAMVFQSFALFPWLTVLENVEIGLEAKGIQSAKRREKALVAIDLIGLDGYENAYPRELSGGMRQRVALARALVVKPALLLMDEPFSALDILTAEILRTDLLDLWIEGDMTIKSMIMVTHNIEEAVLMSDRIFMLESHPGRIIGEISVDLSHPRDRLSPEFRALVEKIYAMMTAGLQEKQDAGRTGLLPGMGIGMILPDVSSNILQGFTERLASYHRCQSNLSTLADSFQIDAGEILKIAEVLQLLRLCELDGADVVLTEDGKKFASAGIDARKQIFKDHLQTYVPLAANILKNLEENSKHVMPLEPFKTQIEHYMPAVAAESTLKIIIAWARYAELFGYDEDTQLLSLEH